MALFGRFLVAEIERDTCGELWMTPPHPTTHTPTHHGTAHGAQDTAPQFNASWRDSKAAQVTFTHTPSRAHGTDCSSRKHDRPTAQPIPPTAQLQNYRAGKGLTVLTRETHTLSVSCGVQPDGLGVYVYS